MALPEEQIINEALALPAAARALLADRLVESLDPAEDSVLGRLWADEAQKRLSELRSGAVKAVPGEEAIAKLRRKYVG